MSDPRFKARESSQYQWRTLGDQFALFDSASGDTHVLDAVVREALACLDIQPLTQMDLLETMAGRLGLEHDAALEQYIVQLLARLDDLGLIEAIEP